jgi:hypothetical protein
VSLRVGLYYAPLPDDPLWHAGNSWLGRDPRTDSLLTQPDLPNIFTITSDARHYGFHATLKPPMRLIGSFDSLLADAEKICDAIAPFDLPQLAVTNLHGFFALCETAPSPALQALADSCVAGVDRHRVPPDDAELARRRKGGLSAEREAMLLRWGYPDVFATWRFHMTLTRRLSAEEAEIFRPAAEAWLAPALSVPRRVSDVCLYVQPAPEKPFILMHRVPLRGEGRR